MEEACRRHLETGRAMANNESLRTVKRTVNPRSQKNLRPWRKGQSGNPGGRPKTLISDASRDWLMQIDLEDRQDQC